MVDQPSRSRAPAVPALARAAAALAIHASAAATLWLASGWLAVAARRQDPVRVALLRPPILLAAAMAIAIAAAATDVPRLRRSLVLLVTLPAALPWIPVRLPAAALVWSGPLAVILWLFAAIGLLGPALARFAGRVRALASPARAPWAAGLAAMAVYAAVHAQVGSQMPSGDEPHYLVVTQSLIEDHDLRVANNYDRGDYRAYFPADLKPDYLQPALDGTVYSVHPPGLPMLVAPAFAAFGYRGVVFFLALVAAAATMMAWRGAWAVTGSAGAAWFGWAAVAFSVPFCFHAFAVYPEAPGAACVMLAALALIERRRSAAWLLAAGFALALLPWLHPRFSIPAGVLLALLALRLVREPGGVRRAALLAALPIASWTAWVGYYWVLYGSPNPASAYGGASGTSLANVPRGLTGLLLDQQFGLLLPAPVFLCAVVGFVALSRRRRRLALELSAVCGSCLIVAAMFGMWWAGFSAPARFLVVMLPPLAVPAAAAFHSARHRASRQLALASLVLTLAVTASIALVDDGALLYQVHDGRSTLLAWMSPLADVTRAFPSMFRADRVPPIASALVWLAAIGATALAGRAAGRLGASGRATAATHALAGCLASLAALSILWHANGVVPFQAPAAGVALLKAVERSPRLTAVRYPPLRILAPADVPSSIALADTAPLERPPDEPLVGIFGPPAGTYELAAELTGRGGGAVSLRLDSRSPPQWTWTLEGDRGVWSAEVHLAATTRGLEVQADAAARRSIRRLTVRAIALDHPADDTPPQRVVRLGPAVVYVLAGRPYVEADGLWTRGARAVDLVVDPDPGVRPRLFLRNAPIANRVGLTIGADRRTLELAPREERLIDIGRPAGGAPRIRIEAARGARPADFDPASADRRELGCWLEIR